MSESKGWKTKSELVDEFVDQLHDLCKNDLSEDTLLPVVYTFLVNAEKVFNRDLELILVQDRERHTREVDRLRGRLDSSTKSIMSLQREVGQLRKLKDWEEFFTDTRISPSYLTPEQLHKVADYTEDLYFAARWREEYE